MTSRERAERSDAIYSSRVQGFAWSQIAREHGLSERQAQRLYAEAERSRASTHSRRDPQLALEELLAGYDSAMNDFAVLARDAKHEHVRLGATRGRITVLEGKFEAMMATGLLPPTLDQIGAHMDGKRAAAAIVEVFERYDVCAEARLDVERALLGPDYVEDEDWEESGA